MLMAEGYSMSGSQANRVTLKPFGTFSGGKRFSVCGPVRAGSSPLTLPSPPGGEGRVKGSKITPRKAAAQVPGRNRPSVVNFMELPREHGDRRSYDGHKTAFSAARDF